jgi:hypothetical protein
VRSGFVDEHDDQADDQEDEEEDAFASARVGLVSAEAIVSDQVEHTSANL